MERCKTCRHWTTPRSTESVARGLCNPEDPDTFEPMERGFEVRICKHPSQTRFESPVERDGFGVADGSNYLAVLATAEEFGCVRHEPAA